MDKEAVERVLAESIRPKLALEGGGVDLVDVSEEGTIAVKLTGACGSCPFSQMTLKAVVEAELKRAFPDMKGVVTR